MRVLVFDTLLSQASERKIPPDVLPRLYKEYRMLATLEKQGYNALYQYLTTGNNGKPLKGSSKLLIYKYQLTDGDRILYTYGKYLPYLHKEKDSLVLLGYSKHDDQGFASRLDIVNSKHSYEYLSNIVRELNKVSDDFVDLPEEDLIFIASLIVSEGFKGYAYTDEELEQFSADEIEKHLVLSQEQEAVISNYQKRNAPTLIIGGAGTGKTLIAVHLLNSLAENGENQPIAYFTQSKLLLQKVQDQYSRIKEKSVSNDSTKIEFWDINKFCLDMLNLEESQLVTTRQFIDVFLNQELCKTSYGSDLLDRLLKNAISYDNIWTEIRGTLKGGMQNWMRIRPMSQDNVSVSVHNLDRMGYIERLKDNKKLFVLKESIAKTIIRQASDAELENADKRALKEIICYFSAFNAELKAIDDEYYLSLSDEVSLLTAEQRQLVLSIYHEYEKYLDRNKLFDENDLVRLVISSGKHKSNSYEFVFIDEVQDYTELQIYLLYQLAANKNGLIFAGDVHQIINPTLFSISKLKELFRDDGGVASLREEYLRTNFRCQKGIIDVANNLSELRREVIGSQSEELEQPEKSNVSICLYDPYRLSYSINNVQSVLAEVSKYPQVAVLVPNENTKRYLLEITADHSRPEFIFTVDEIKGMEFDYVICYNLVSHYSKQWTDIIASDIGSARTRYRYYFNLLYVAITRARKLLCFIDEQPLPGLEARLCLKNETDFDPELLHFADLDASLVAWAKQADDFKLQGKYSVAIQYYQKAKDMADPADILDCNIYIAEENREYELAVKYCILMLALKDSENIRRRLQQNAKLVRNNPNIGMLADFLLEKTNNIEDISRIIREEFEIFSSAEQHSVIQLCLQRAECIICDLIDNKRIPSII